MLSAVALAAALVIMGCRQETPVLTSRFQAFGSQVDLSLVRVDARLAREAAAAVERDFMLMQEAWNAWEPGPMGRVNLMLPKGEPFVAPPSVLPLVRLSQRYFDQSGGLFNPAMGHLIELWGFQRETPECQPPPSDRSIDRLVQAAPKMSDIQIRGLELKGDNPALMLDFGDLAKGHAIDLAIEHLRELGVRHALVQVGTDLRAIGDRSGQPWRIAIRRPSGSGVLAILPVRGDESVATAAAYDRNFLYAGATYHNILDPRTGRPADGAMAVTVAHGDAATAEAAATALFIAGPSDWPRVAQAMGVRYVMLVDSHGTVHLNPGMHERIEMVDQDAVLAVTAPLEPAAERPEP
jgi:thiamine biosynthesis lipoprotein